MIDHELAGFLEEGLGIHIGTRDAELQPSGARATAVFVDPGGELFDVHVPAGSARALLLNLHANGQAAVVFARPRDDRSCQVKGEFLSVRDTRAEERPAVEAQWNAFLMDLEHIGIPRAMAGQWVAWPSVVIRLKATSVFDQTPGPKAGAAIA